MSPISRYAWLRVKYGGGWRFVIGSLWFEIGRNGRITFRCRKFRFMEKWLFENYLSESRYWRYLFNINCYLIFFLILLLFDITITENYSIVLILDINYYLIMLYRRLFTIYLSSFNFFQWIHTSVVSLKTLLKAPDNIFPISYIIARLSDRLFQW